MMPMAYNTTTVNQIKWTMTVVNNATSSDTTTDNISSTLSSGAIKLPADMTFDKDDHWKVAAYVSLFFVSAVFNLTVLVTLLCNRRSCKSHVNRFIIHLCLADLVVTFIIIPLELIWTITVAWHGGEAACRVLMFFRAFGFYLSSFLLVTISLDRYFAILHPFSRVKVANKRAQMMLAIAWTLAFVASTPQSVVFHTVSHPNYEWFEQCVTFNFFPTPRHEQAYNVFNVLTIFIIPLIIILVSYGVVLWTVTIKSLQQQLSDSQSNTGGGRLQGTLCSGFHRIQRARMKTLAMTLVIVIAFITCWAPYYVMSVWYWLDSESAQRVNPVIQRCLFFFALASSCTNPIVYGMFTINFKRELERCWLPRSRLSSMSLTIGYSSLANSRRSTHSTVVQHSTPEQRHVTVTRLGDPHPSSSWRRDKRLSDMVSTSLTSASSVV